MDEQVSQRARTPTSAKSVDDPLAQRLADGATPFAVARALGIDRKTVLKYAGHLPYHPQHQPKAALAE